MDGEFEEDPQLLCESKHDGDVMDLQVRDDRNAPELFFLRYYCLNHKAVTEECCITGWNHYMQIICVYCLLKNSFLSIDIRPCHTL